MIMKMMMMMMMMMMIMCSSIITVIDAADSNSSSSNDATTTSTTAKMKYGCMIDAGSSGTRIYIYQWPDTVAGVFDVKNAKPIGQKDWSKKVNPGISDAEKDPPSVIVKMRDLIAYAKEKVPEERWSDTTIFLKATAGMRLVVEKDKIKADEIMKHIRDFLGNHNESPFAFDRDEAMVMPGEDEGAFGWITVNYLAGKIGEDPALVPHKTAAALDLGGASTQITFVAKEAPLSNYYPLLVGTHHYPLYTHSYLKHGMNEAYRRYSEYATEQAGIDVASGTGEWSDVCMFSGYTGTQTIASSSSSSTTGGDVKQTGAADGGKCLDLVRQTFFDRYTAFCPTEPCSFNGVHQPPIPDDMSIYAFSGYWYTASFFDCVGETTPACFKTAVVEKCQQWTWDKVKADYPDSAENQWAYERNYCFSAAYIYQLWTVGYHIDETRTINVVHDVNKADVSWTLGAMMYEAGEDLRLPASPYHSGTGGGDHKCPAASGSTIMAIAGVAASVVFAIIVLGCVYKMRWKKSSDDDGHDAYDRL